MCSDSNMMAFSTLGKSFIDNEDGTTRFLASILGDSEDPDINKINAAVGRAVLSELPTLKAALNNERDLVPKDIKLFPWVGGKEADLSFVLGDVLVVLENKIARGSIRSGQLLQLWEGVTQSLGSQDSQMSRGLLVFLVPNKGVGHNEISNLPGGGNCLVELVVWDKVLSGIKKTLDANFANMKHPWITWIETSIIRIEELIAKRKEKKSHDQWNLLIKEATKDIVNKVKDAVATMGFSDSFEMTPSGGVDNAEERYGRFQRNPGRGVYLYVLHNSDVADSSKWTLRGEMAFTINKNSKKLLGKRYGELLRGWEEIKILRDNSRLQVSPFLKELKLGKGDSMQFTRTFGFDPCSREESIGRVVSLYLDMLDQFRNLLVIPEEAGS